MFLVINTSEGMACFGLKKKLNGLPAAGTHITTTKRKTPSANARLILCVIIPGISRCWGRRHRLPWWRPMGKTHGGASLAQLYTCHRGSSVRDQGTRADPDPAQPWLPKRDRTAEPNNEDSR